MHAEAASNQHLRVQNPNLDIEGGLWAPHPSALGGSQVSDRNYISDCAELWKGWLGVFLIQATRSQFAWNQPLFFYPLVI
jgi:hypothetical protein